MKQKATRAICTALTLLLLCACDTPDLQGLGTLLEKANSAAEKQAAASAAPEVSEAQPQASSDAPEPIFSEWVSGEWSTDMYNESDTCRLVGTKTEAQPSYGEWSEWSAPELVALAPKELLAQEWFTSTLGGIGDMVYGVFDIGDVRIVSFEKYSPYKRDDMYKYLLNNETTTAEYSYWSQTHTILNERPSKTVTETLPSGEEQETRTTLIEQKFPCVDATGYIREGVYVLGFDCCVESTYGGTPGYPAQQQTRTRAASGSGAPVTYYLYEFRDFLNYEEILEYEQGRSIDNGIGNSNGIGVYRGTTETYTFDDDIYYLSVDFSVESGRITAVDIVDYGAYRAEYASSEEERESCSNMRAWLDELAAGIPASQSFDLPLREDCWDEWHYAYTDFLFAARDALYNADLGGLESTPQWFEELHPQSGDSLPIVKQDTLSERRKAARAQREQQEQHQKQEQQAQPEEEYNNVYDYGIVICVCAVCLLF